MSDPTPVVNGWYLRTHGIEPLKSFGPNIVPATKPTGYVLVEDAKGPTPYWFKWSSKDAVLYLQRVRRNGSYDPLKLAVAITDTTALEDQLKMRNATRKEGPAPFKPYGTLKAVVGCMDLESYDLIMRVLRFVANDSTAPPAQDEDDEKEPSATLTMYNELTEHDLIDAPEGTCFYATRQGQVFRCTLERTGDYIRFRFEELSVNGKPFRVMYLDQGSGPSKRRASRRQNEGANWRGSIGPFQYVFSSDKPMMPNEIRAHFKLAGRHKPQPR